MNSAKGKGGYLPLNGKLELPFNVYPVTVKRFLSGLESDSYFERSMYISMYIACM